MRETEAGTRTTTSAQDPKILTERLLLRLGRPTDADAMVAYLQENRSHLEPFEPARSPVDFTTAFWADQFRRRLKEFHSDKSMRMLLFDRSNEREIIGTLNFSNFVRSVKQSCTMGYGIGGNHQGKGLMSEAVSAGLSFTFGTLGFHKIEAGYMPWNTRSGSLLKKLGFVVEGYARDHVRINGRWEDHILTSLTNPRWVEPAPVDHNGMKPACAAIDVQPIGSVRCSRTEPLDDNWGSVVSEITLDSTRFDHEAVAGVGDFSHLEVVYQFHRVAPESVEVAARHPQNREDWPKVGIFAQRGKARPNRIGVSRCRLLEVDGLTLKVVGLDAIDGTPVLDIKPYMVEFGPIGEVRQPAWAGEIMARYYAE